MTDEHEKQNAYEQQEYEMINGMKIPLKDRQTKGAPKRFYKSVFVEQAEQGFCVKLDQRILKSPEHKGDLVWPSRDLAQRVAQEWDFQEKLVILGDMPMTTLSYSSLGRDNKTYQELRTELLSYAASDLILYRSTNPQKLVSLQENGWNPILDWLDKHYSAPFTAVQGIGYVEQPARSLEQIRLYLDKTDDDRLAALMSMTKISGSFFLSMATCENYLPVQQIWDLAMIDDVWQAGQWGDDPEQQKKRLLMNRDFAAAADFIKLL